MKRSSTIHDDNKKDLTFSQDGKQRQQEHRGRKKYRSRRICFFHQHYVLVLLLISILLCIVVVQFGIFSFVVHPANVSFLVEQEEYQPVQRREQEEDRRRHEREKQISPVSSSFLSCQDLFGRNQIVKINRQQGSSNNRKRLLDCLEHKSLLWIACNVGNVQVDVSKISGSFGGEDMSTIRSSFDNSKNDNNNSNSTTSIYGRTDEEEQLTFHFGSFHFYHPERVPNEALFYRMDKVFQSIINVNKNKDKEKQQVQKDSIDVTNTTTMTVSSASTTSKDNGVTLLVRRNNYANPCMTILTLYNVYIIVRYFFDGDDYNIDVNANNRNNITIIWLDGHAQSNLDDVWYDLFHTKPIHIKQLAHDHQSDQTNDDQKFVLSNVIFVNTQSAIGEGYGRYLWNNNNNNNNDKTIKEKNANKFNTTMKYNNHANAASPIETKLDYNIYNNDNLFWKQQQQHDSTLIDFRNFVLHRYGLLQKHQQHQQQQQQRQKQKQKQKQRPILTLLSRIDYISHPRSLDGMTDRIFDNVNDDIQYLQTLYPYHQINVVSFENITFYEQLQHIIQTDILVSIHGAGNIHVLFLPIPNAQLIEYFPKGFIQRKRFRFLFECMSASSSDSNENSTNLKYQAKPAWIVQRRGTNQKKISVRIRPTTQQEKNYQLT